MFSLKVEVEAESVEVEVEEALVEVLVEAVLEEAPVILEEQVVVEEPQVKYASIKKENLLTPIIFIGTPNSISNKGGSGTFNSPPPYRYSNTRCKNDNITEK